MTRNEAAQEIAARINSNEDFRATTWSKGGHVRVYVKKDTGGKKGFVDAGFISIDEDGDIELENDIAWHFQYDKQTLNHAVDVVVEVNHQQEETAQPTVIVDPQQQDENEQDWIRSQYAIYNSESARELG